MRLFCNMIVDIHCDLCIRMFFAPLRSVLNGCPPDIQHPITYCITLGLTLFSPSLVHPVWRRVCDEIGGISSGSRFSSSASLLSFLIIGINNVFQKTVHSRRHNRTSMLCIENESTTSTDLNITLFLFGKRKSTVKPIIQRFSVLFSYYIIEYPSFCLYKWNLAKLKLNLFQTIQFGYSPTVDYFSVHQFPTYRLLPCIHKSLINTFLFH